MTSAVTSTWIIGWAVLVLAVASPASADVARFRASIEGVQKISWSVEKTEGGGFCGGTYRGSGRETVRFHSARPQRLTVRVGARGVPSFAMGRRWAAFDTRGAVSRHGALSFVLGPNGVPCGDGGGGETPEPAAPDCGTKRFSLLPIVPEPVGRNAIRMAIGDPAPLPPFRNCPVYGQAFPELLTGGPVDSLSTPLPVSELLDRSIGKEIVLGGGHRRESAAGITVDTRLRWTLTLERIQRRRPFLDAR
jgi:hypothetical protein